MMQRIRALLTWKVILGGGLVAACLFSALVALLGVSRRGETLQAAGTAVMYVIPAPSATPPAPIASATPTAGPTEPIPTAPPGGAIAVGAYVQITGTGGDGLRLRADPGLEGTVRFLAIDAEVFQVMDGPRSVDGYNWWLLQAPYDPAVQGWAVENYLLVVQNP